MDHGHHVPLTSRQLNSLHLWWSGVVMASAVRASSTRGKAPSMLNRGFRSTWLHRRRVQLLNWTAGQILDQQKTSENQKSSNEGPSDQSGTTFLSENSRNWSPHVPDVDRQMLKDNSNSLEMCCCHQSPHELIFSMKYRFQRLTWSLCSTGNKIMALWAFIYVLHSVPTFLVSWTPEHPSVFVAWKT